MLPRVPRKYVPLLSTAVVWALLYAVACVLYPGFFSLRVFADFFSDNSFLGIIAVGMTFVILSGGIDLSVGSMVALCSIVLAVLVELHGWHPLCAIAVVLALGTTLGLGTGSIIRYFGLPPFIVTLGGMFFARGLALIVRNESVPIQHGFYRAVTTWALTVGDGRVRVTSLVFLAVVAVGIYLAACTIFGRNVYAVGGNEEAALLMGVPVGWTKQRVYALSGFCSALAGVVFTFYGSSGNPAAAVGMELDAIAAVVIGGTLLSGGVGYVFGTLIGVLIFGTIQTAIIFDGRLSSWWTRVAIGALLLLFILLQKLLARPVASRR
ncbi:MAG: galactofuranose ABC transporter, permease protein YjfF [bacterium]